MGSTMDHSSDDDTDMSDSEMDEFAAQSYEELKKKHSVNETFMCPYCPQKEKQDYLYRDLLQHASGVGKSTSNKRYVKERANHSALVKYLVKDLADSGSTSEPKIEEKALLRFWY